MDSHRTFCWVPTFHATNTFLWLFGDANEKAHQRKRNGKFGGLICITPVWHIVATQISMETFSKTFIHEICIVELADQYITRSIWIKSSMHTHNARQKKKERKKPTLWHSHAYNKTYANQKWFYWNIWPKSIRTHTFIQTQTHLICRFFLFHFILFSLINTFNTLDT